MPRYFFDVMDGQGCPDHAGTDLPDLAAAQAEAVRASGAILRDMGARLWNSREWSMAVRDESGQSLFTLRMAVQEDETQAHRAAGR